RLSRDWSSDVCSSDLTSLTEPAEDVLEAARTGAAGGEARTRSHGADLVVLLALLRVGEHCVRLADLFELCFGLGIALVGIRVILARQLAIRLLQFCIADVLGDAEHLVEVLVEPILAGHRSPGP